MSTRAIHETSTSHDAAPGAGGLIVVGVDGSEPNRSALRWAAHEAELGGRRLDVLVASGTAAISLPAYSEGLVTIGDYRQTLDRLAGSAAAELKAAHPTLDIGTSSRLGSAADALLSAANTADEVVVGKRGMGAFARIIVGSTSIAVAGRSAVPVIVVPDGWQPEEDDRRPVVVGVDPAHQGGQALDFAFDRAARLGVAVRVIHALDAQPAVDGVVGDLHEWAAASLRAVRAAVADATARHPGVDADVEQVADVAALALLNAAEDAQLLVLGRSTHSERLGGFAFGSVGRAVLHYSETPVAIVPMDVATS